MNTKRPNCINCGKSLGKYVTTMSVPFDCDVWAYIPEELKGREYKMMDSLTTVRVRQEKMREGWGRRLKQMEEARLKLAPGSNEPIANTHRGRWDRQMLESSAKEPTRSHYDVQVRIWLGHWGPDGRGLFHSQECARRWANKIAGNLRERGEI